MPKSFDFAQAPGHLIRRAQQIAVAEFTREAAAHDVTPVQFAFMNAMMDTPGVDQITLANQVAFDAATSGSVIGRLEAKGWVRREADASATAMSPGVATSPRSKPRRNASPMNPPPMIPMRTVSSSRSLGA